MELSPEQQVIFKQKLLETYDAFYSFCNDNHLTFFAAYGTAIGAVRNHGIIPWDDDIDVFMLPGDYKRFLSLKHGLSGTDYEIVDLDTPNYYLHFAKFQSKNTSILEMASHPLMLGMYIDVFPLYEVSGSIKKIQKEFTKLARCSNLLLALSSSPVPHYGDGRKNLKTLIKDIFKIFLSPILVKPVIRSLKKGYKSKGGGSHYYVPISTVESLPQVLYPASIFSSGIKMPFDGRNMMVPIGYDEMLRMTFGDYMTLPPEDQREPHHYHYYFNLYKRVSYIEALAELSTNEQA